VLGIHSAAVNIPLDLHVLDMLAKNEVELQLNSIKIQPPAEEDSDATDIKSEGIEMEMDSTVFDSDSE